MVIIQPKIVFIQKQLIPLIIFQIIYQILQFVILLDQILYNNFQAMIQNFHIISIKYINQLELSSQNGYLPLCLIIYFYEQNIIIQFFSSQKFQIILQMAEEKALNRQNIKISLYQFIINQYKKSNIIMTQNSDSHRNDTSRIPALVEDRLRKTIRLKIKEEKIQDEEDSFDIKRPAPKRRKSKKFNKHWLKEDNISYLRFLLQNSHHFSSQVLRRCNKVFLRMSEAMKNRKNPKQCKSHHQKMLNYTVSRTTEQIIRYLLIKFKDNNLREQIRKQYLETQKVRQNVQISDDLKQFLNKQLNEQKIEQKDEQIVSKYKKRRSKKYHGQKRETLPILDSQNQYTIKVNNDLNTFTIVINLLCPEFESW